MNTALSKDFAMSDHDTIDVAVLQTLQDATKAHTDSSARLEIVEGQVETLEAAFRERMGRLEDQMGTTNAHLDNIAREAAITNDLLRQELDHRQEERKRQQALEDEERKEAREEKKANRDLLVKTGKELWSIFKQPLGYLVAAALAYTAFVWFGHEEVQLAEPAQAEVLPQTEIPPIEVHPTTEED